MSPHLTFLELLGKLKTSQNSFSRMKSVSHLWKFLSSLDSDERASLLTELGIKEGERLLERFLQAPGTNSQEITAWAENLVRSIDRERVAGLAARQLGPADAATLDAVLEVLPFDPSARQDDSENSQEPAENGELDSNDMEETVSLSSSQVPPAPAASDERANSASPLPDSREDLPGSSSETIREQTVQSMAGTFPSAARSDQTTPPGEMEESLSHDEEIKLQTESSTANTSAGTRSSQQAPPDGPPPITQAPSEIGMEEPGPRPRHEEPHRLEKLQAAALSPTTRYRIARDVVEQTEYCDVEIVRQLLEMFPKGWMRRRLTVAILEKPGQEPELIRFLFGELQTQADFLWFGGALSRSKEISPLLLDEFLQKVPSSRLRRSFSRRLAHPHPE